MKYSQNNNNSIDDIKCHSMVFGLTTEAPGYFDSNDLQLFDNKSLAKPEMVLPSALPANCLLAAPITLPISAGDVAPTAAIIFTSSAFISSADNCCGKNFEMIAISSSSFLARSARFCC